MGVRGVGQACYWMLSTQCNCKKCHYKRHSNSSKVKVKVKIVNFVFTTGKCQNISTLEDDGKSVWIVMLYYTVLIRWEMMAAAGEREGEGKGG